MNNFNTRPKNGYGFIYKYTSPSGKSYIGQTIYSLQERAKTNTGTGYSHCSIFFRAIKKYGFNNFKWEILGEYPISELDEKEKNFIEQYNTIAPNGYNIYPGGAVAYIKGQNCKHKIDQYDLEGNYIKTFDSVIEAAKEMKTSYQSISAVLGRRRTQHNGYIYRYFEEEPPKPIKIKKIKGRKTAQYDLNGNFIAVYPSAIKAALAIGKNENAARNIRSVCYGDRQTAYGFVWKFLD